MRDILDIILTQFLGFVDHFFYLLGLTTNEWYVFFICVGAMIVQGSYQRWHLPWLVHSLNQCGWSEKVVRGVN